MAPTATASTAVIGALLRVQASDRAVVCDQTDALPGVSSFSVGDPERVGLLIESDTVEAALQFLQDHVAHLPGVCAAWPVYGHEEPAVRRG